jgi:hypothetical protein
MNPIVLFLLFFSSVYSFTAKACSEQMYCIHEGSMIYTSYKDLVIINLKKKFKKDLIKLPENLFKNVSGKICSLKCSKKSISLLAGEKEYILKVTNSSSIEMVAEKPRPQPFENGSTLGIGADRQDAEIFSDASNRVILEVLVTEKRIETRGKTTIEVNYETKVVKIDKLSNKKIDEISVFKDFRDIN